MGFELEGKLIEKFDLVVVSEKFQKLEFVLETEENAGGNVYTQNIKFQLIQAKCSEIDRANIGENIKVHFNLQGRKWEKDGKVSYFNSLTAWKIEKKEEIPIPTPPQAGASSEESFPNTEEDGTDLPF